MSWLWPLVLLLLVAGAAFMFVAALGVVRMPDLFTRMQAATKAAALGVGLVLLSAALYFEQLSVATRALATIGFVFLTVPISAHLVGRAAYVMGVPLWDRTITDELKDAVEPGGGEPEPDAGRAQGPADEIYG